MIVSLILITCSITLAIFAILYMSTHRKNFGTQIIIILISLIYLFQDVLFLPFLTLSVDLVSVEDVALQMWKSAILFRLISLGLVLTLANFMILYSRLNYYLTFIYSLLLGFIISLLSLPNSIEITRVGNVYIYTILNPVLIVLITVFDLFIIGLLIFTVLKNFSSFRNPFLGQLLLIFASYFSIPILMNTIYITTQILFFKDFNYLLNIFGSIFILYTLLRMPDFYVVLTNKIYDFIIFQKSGILLYSYNFETGKETDESFLKGSILIGINHILTNFTYKKDQLNLIKMKDRDLLFEYDTYYGYALLIITNQKNMIIQKAVKQFMRKFNDLNKEKLKEINNFSQLIDVSAFKNAKDLIYEYFLPYLKKQGAFIKDNV